MAKSRVLVVDDAVVFRRMLTETLSADPELDVVGAAVNGKVALQQLAATKVDAVVLDVEMPELDGIATLKEIRKLHPRLPVIMFSSLTQRGAEATLDALSFGADDYFTKPTTSGLDASVAVVKSQLIPKLKAIIAQETLRAAKSLSRPSIPALAPKSCATGVEIVVVAASTGGPNALLAFFRQLPADLPVPVAVVQHMPPMFTRLLAERLSSNSPLKVAEAVHGQPLERGTAVLAPGDFHLEIERCPAGALRTRLQQNALENSVRPAADVLFRSAAAVCKSGVLAVVLTGMGQDGKAGAECIVAAGGRILAQDEESSVVWGMPGAVVRAGLAESVYSLNELPDAVLRRLPPRRLDGLRR